MGTGRGEERRGTYSVLVAKCKGKRKLGRNGGRWEDNIKICLQGIEWDWVFDAYGGEERNKQHFGEEM
jgi:hypothetical protein